MATDQDLPSSEDGSRAQRLSRWTREDILVLIRGKKFAENRVKELASHSEPKWVAISSYCKKNGVNRSPNQCRKRWGNLGGDFRKIQQWESRISDESQSFWAMSSDLRRKKKLPGFFDREVYDMLTGGSSEEEIDEIEEAEVLLGSSRVLADGLFSCYEQGDRNESPEKEAPSIYPSSTTKIFSPIPLSEMKYQSYQREFDVEDDDDIPGERVGSNSARKRRGSMEEDEDGVRLKELVGVIGRSGRMLSAQLEAQNMTLQLDREQRNEHGKELVGVLNKIADAVGKIAEKF